MDTKTDEYQKYMRELLDKHCPEKTISVTNLDKPWMNPQLKLILRQVQRERLRHGKGGKFKEQWAKYRRLKRARIRNFQQKFFQELKATNPSMWYQKIKQLGGLDQMSRGKLKIK